MVRAISLTSVSTFNLKGESHDNHSRQFSHPPPAPIKKKSFFRVLIKLVAVLLLLLVVGLVIVYFNLNNLVQAGVVRGGKYATDQETALQEANLALFNGALSLDGLDISNLQGYKEPKLLVMKKCETIIEPMSVLSSTVEIKSITIDGLELTLEQNGMKNNISELMEILKKKSPAATPAAGPGSASPPSDSPGKKLVIDTLMLTGTKVHVRAAPLRNLDLDLGPDHDEESKDQP